MSGRAPKTPEPLVAVARVVKKRGLKGELVAELLTDFPQRFERTSKFVGVGPNEKRVALELEGHWFQKGRIVLKFKGYDSVESAAALIGYELAIPESERMPLDEGSFYDWELQGCIVKTSSGNRIGHVTGVLRTGGVELLVVEGEGRTEHLIPMVNSIVLNVDLGEREIFVDPPEGLLDL
ncbi:MAG TPA: ribosome maturation factor RimM [Pyrinomonadaceae bacterium]|nr:ribosome maturation factor RimM [Pyrinomonadaceae bacterium]